AEDVTFILDHFFMAQWDRMIRVYPRYKELLELRRVGRRPAAAAASEFSVQDLRDLQVWFDLAWFHPVSFEESPVLRELRAKGRGFTEEDKAAMLREQKQVLAKVIPLHKELARRGQLELTTTPFYHPILPLLCDMRSAHAALPRHPLPANHVPLVEDAQTQLQRAVEYHRGLFGEAPKGLWPSEGSVSADILPLIARNGIQWIATDEEILSHSLGAPLRNGALLQRPDLLYRAWRVQSPQSEALNILFRDHQLSDLIGFQYQSWDGTAAAEDLLLHVQESAQRVAKDPETLVPVILDGENCWEHYPEQGLKFLRSLYARLESLEHGVQAVRISDFLESHPPTRQLETLFSGSWINHDFYIWVGHAEDRRAWEYVYRVREDLVAATKAQQAQLPGSAGVPPATKAGGTPALPGAGLARAWEELYIAEGSDWYWWYGDDRTSGNDDAFDNLFRLHLKNAYKFLGQPAPFFLNVPVKGVARAGRYTSPSASLRVKVDGRCTSYFEWLPAGRYRADKEGGVMAAAQKPLLEQIFFGYEERNLCVRIDLYEKLVRPQPAKSGKTVLRQPGVASVALRFTDLSDALLEGQGRTLTIDPADASHLSFAGAWEKSGPKTVEAAWDDILEVKIPFAAIGAREGQELSFYVVVTSPGGTVERFPRTCALQFAVPPENVDEQEWMA
ncbi:MAG: glycoside hydrolase family 57 protein, partial [Planctomycetota bacterium]